MSQTTTPATLNLAPGSHSGLSHSDGITNDTAPVIVGTAPPNVLVTLTDYADSSFTVPTRADKQGNYPIVAQCLVDGAHAFTVTTTNAAAGRRTRLSSLARVATVRSTSPSVPPRPPILLTISP